MTSGEVSAVKVPYLSSHSKSSRISKGEMLHCPKSSHLSSEEDDHQGQSQTIGVWMCWWWLTTLPRWPMPSTVQARKQNKLHASSGIAIFSSIASPKRSKFREPVDPGAITNCRCEKVEDNAIPSQRQRPYWGFNRILGNMITAFPPRHKNKWPKILQTLTFAYNCTAHESTGYAFFYLLYGRIPRLPVNVMFHNVERDNNITDHDSYVNRVREEL